MSWTSSRRSTGSDSYVKAIRVMTRVQEALASANSCSLAAFVAICPSRPPEATRFPTANLPQHSGKSNSFCEKGPTKIHGKNGAEQWNDGCQEQSPLRRRRTGKLDGGQRRRFP